MKHPLFACLFGATLLFLGWLVLSKERPLLKPPRVEPGGETVKTTPLALTPRDLKNAPERKALLPKIPDEKRLPPKPPLGETIRGQILDRLTGLPITGAFVQALPWGPKRQSDEKGIFQISGLEKKWEIQVWAEGFRSVRSSHHTFSGRIILTPKPVITLRILKPEGFQNPERIRIDYCRVSAKNTAAPSVSEDRPWPPDGFLYLNEPPPGLLLLRLYAKTQKGLLLRGKTAPFSIPHQTPILVSLQPAPSITGRIVDPKGAPCAGIQTWLQGKREKSITDSKGRFFLSPLQPGLGSLVVRNPGKSSRIIPFDFSGGNQILDLGVLTLPHRTGRISGFLNQVKGRPQKGATILLRSAGLNPWDFTATVDQKGAFTIAGLPWGRWEILIFPKGTSPPLHLNKTPSQATVQLTPDNPQTTLHLIFPKKSWRKNQVNR